MFRDFLARNAIAISLEFFFIPAVAQVHVATYHNNYSRDGQNLNEVLLAPANVNTTTFSKVFDYDVDGCIYAQPLYVSGVNVPGVGTVNVVFVATQHNSVYAFNADAPNGPNGGLLWHVNFGPSAATPNPDFGNRFGGFVEITPEVGITGTPVIDLNSGTLYVDAFTHEGSSYFHRLHALNITNGVEKPFSPVLVTGSVPGAGVGGSGGVVTFDPKQQLQRSALTLAAGILYVNYASYAITDPYHGWIFGYRASDLQKLSNYTFNTSPNGTIAQYGDHAGEAGIWMGGGGICVDSQTNLYFATGNGIFNAFNGTGGTEYGDSLMKLSTANGFSILDYFAPYEEQYLADNDLDLGSGGVMLLPDQPGPIPHLLTTCGKTGKLYVVNRDQFTEGDIHCDNINNVDHVIQTYSLVGGSFATPAWFNGRIYHAATGQPLVSFPFLNGQFDLGSQLTGPRAFNFPGSTPSVSANGTQNGIIWTLQRGTTRAVLSAYNPTSLATELYNSDSAGTRDQLPTGIKFAVPTIANGKVYVGSTNSLVVFGLFGGDPYLVWKNYFFGPNANNPAVAGDSIDPDHDGIMNLLEFAFASNPTNQDTASPVSGEIVANHFQVQFSRNISAQQTFRVRTSTAVNGPWNDLMTYTPGAGWTANIAGATATESTATGSVPNQSVAVTVTDPNSASTGARFYQVVVQ